MPCLRSKQLVRSKQLCCNVVWDMQNQTCYEELIYRCLFHPEAAWLRYSHHRKQNKLSDKESQGHINQYCSQSGVSHSTSWDLSQLQQKRRRKLSLENREREGSFTKDILWIITHQEEQIQRENCCASQECQAEKCWLGFLVVLLKECWSLDQA